MTHSNAVRYAVIFLAGLVVGATLDMRFRSVMGPSSDRPPIPTEAASAQPPPPRRAVSGSGSDRGQTTSHVRQTQPKVPGPQVTREDLLVRYPPPHIANPAFYGPTVNTEEAERLRQKSLGELAQSLRESGYPEADITAMLEAASTEPAKVGPQLREGSDDPDAVPASLDEKAQDLSESMRAAEIPVAHMTPMVDSIYQAKDAPQTRGK